MKNNIKAQPNNEEKLKAYSKIVLEYLWRDEERHYLESDRESRKDHIFPVLKEIKKILKIRIKK